MLQKKQAQEQEQEQEDCVCLVYLAPGDPLLWVHSCCSKCKFNCSYYVYCMLDIVCPVCPGQTSKCTCHTDPDPDPDLDRQAGGHPTSVLEGSIGRISTG